MKKALILLLCSVIILSYSCDMAFLDRPIPIDSKSLKKIPNKYHGSWELKRKTITISGEFVSIEYRHMESMDRETTEKIKFIEKGDKLYAYDLEEGSMILLESITKTNDSLFYTYNHKEKFTIAHNLEVKKFEEGLMMNLSRPNPEQNTQWWQANYLVKENDKLIYFQIDPDSEHSLLMESRIHDTKDYFQANWNKETVKTLLEEGVFKPTSDTLYLD